MWVLATTELCKQQAYIQDWSQEKRGKWEKEPRAPTNVNYTSLKDLYAIFQVFSSEHRQ